jgi:hypothetical protein
MDYRSKDLGLKGVFNFRAVPGSRDEEVIRQVSAMGHEIGNPFHLS